MAGQAFLSAEFERRVRSNPRYSLRAFARDLAMSPGEVSEIIKGKRRLTAKAIAKISVRLGLNASETQALLGAANLEASGLNNAEIQTRELSADLFRVVSDWYCFAILNLFDTVAFRADPKWIGSRLGISPAEAKLALERLERVGLTRRVKGRLERDAAFVISSSGIPSEAIRSYHKQVLTKAMQALETQPVNERDITGLGIALDTRDLPDLIGELRKF